MASASSARQVAQVRAGAAAREVAGTATGRQASLAESFRNACLSGGCFSGDTELMARGEWGVGWRRINAITLEDEVLSRPEDDPQALPQWKQVEVLFSRSGFVAHLHIRGEVIRTTLEHPFYVQNKGWMPASELQPGDLLSSHDGRWIAVEEVYDTGDFEAVYNLRVADFHTYFVGGSDWGFSVWAHNTSCDARALRKALNAVGEIAKTGEQAAHIVPTGAFTGRILQVQNAIKTAQKAIASIGLNAAPNGFFATAGHNGTHTNAYFLELGRLMRNAMKDGNVAEVLANIKAVRGKIV